MRTIKERQKAREIAWRVTQEILGGDDIEYWFRLLSFEQSLARILLPIGGEGIFIGLWLWDLVRGFRLPKTTEGELGGCSKQHMYV